MESSWHKKPRKTSDARGGFPYADERVPFILIVGAVDLQGDGMNWSNQIDEKLSLVRHAQRDEDVSILTVWPGKGRTDVFVIDDLSEAETALEAAR